MDSTERITDTTLTGLRGKLLRLKQRPLVELPISVDAIVQDIGYLETQVEQLYDRQQGLEDQLKAQVTAVDGAKDEQEAVYAAAQERATVLGKLLERLEKATIEELPEVLAALRALHRDMEKEGDKAA